MKRHKNWFRFIVPIYFIFVIFFNISEVSASNKNTLELKEYLSNKKVLRVSVLEDWKPYVYKENNTYKGIAIEILKSIQKKTGLELKLIPAGSYGESIELLKKGKVDIAAVDLQAGENKNNAQSGRTFTPYFKVPIQLLTYRNNNLFEKENLVIARVRGARYLNTERYSFISVIEYDTIEQCIDSVRSRQADFMCMDMYMSTIFTERLKSKDFIVKNIPEHDIEMGFGIAKELNISFISLLEQEIASFTTAERSRLINIEGEHIRGYKKILNYVYNHPFEVICFTISIAFAVFVCMFTYARIYVRHHKELQGYEESYRVLAETFGEAGWEYDYLKDEMIMFGKNRTKIELPDKIEQFSEKLEQRRLPITLDADEFEAMLFNSCEGQSNMIEFQCKAKDTGWNWYQLIYIVVCTSESHSRPIRLIGCLVDIEKEHEEKEQLLELGSNDRLTGLLNRSGAERLILKRLEQKTEKEEDILLLMDVDHFKLFNDNYGHLCGDKVLSYLGKKLKEEFSTENILCRWGGDEFLIYLENVDGSIDVVEKLIIQLQKEMEKFRYKDVNYPVRISVGGIRVVKKQEWEFLFKRVDEILYRVKEKGRNSFLLE